MPRPFWVDFAGAHRPAALSEIAVTTCSPPPTRSRSEVLGAHAAAKERKINLTSLVASLIAKRHVATVPFLDLIQDGDRPEPCRRAVRLPQGLQVFDGATASARPVEARRQPVGDDPRAQARRSASGKPNRACHEGRGFIRPSSWISTSSSPRRASSHITSRRHSDASVGLLNQEIEVGDGEPGDLFADRTSIDPEEQAAETLATRRGRPRRALPPPERERRALELRRASTANSGRSRTSAASSRSRVSACASSSRTHLRLRDRAATRGDRARPHRRPRRVGDRDISPGSDPGSDPERRCRAAAQVRRQPCLGGNDDEEDHQYPVQISKARSRRCRRRGSAGQPPLDLELAGARKLDRAGSGPRVVEFWIMRMSKLTSGGKSRRSAPAGSRTCRPPTCAEAERSRCFALLARDRLTALLRGLGDLVRCPERQPDRRFPRTEADLERGRTK